MAFPVSPTNGQQSTIANIVYQYDSATNSWTVVPGYANIITATGNITAGNLITGGLVSATGNVTSAGNVSGTYLLGNVFYATGISASKIYNGTSEANIGTSDGNANISIGGTSNVAVFATTGQYVTGVISATGNITGSNVISNAQVVATGNITSSANVQGANLVATSNLVSVGAVVSGNITGGNLLTAGLISATGNITSSANVQGANLIATSGITAGTTIVATGNVTGSNLTTAGQVSATGNITGGNLVTGERVVATGNIVSSANIAGGNLAVTGAITSATIETTGNVLVGGNLTVQGNIQYINVDDLQVEDPIIIMGAGPNGAPLTTDDGMDRGIYQAYYKTGSARGNAWMGWQNNTGNLIAAANVTFTGNNIVSVLTYGTFQTGNVYAQSTLVTGNVTGGNLLTAGLVSATGNINGGNLNATTGVQAATGYFTGNVDVLGNLNASIGIVYANSGIFYGNAVTGNNAAFAGVPGFTQLGSNVVMQFAGNVNSYSQLNFQNISNGTSASTDFIATADNGSDTSYYVDVGINSSTFNDPINYPGFGPNDSYVHNHGGNLILNPETAGKTIKLMVGGTANNNVVGNVSSTGFSITGVVTANGNITGGNLLTAGLISATGNVQSSANITGANLVASANLVSVGAVVSGNITGGNLLTAGQAVATGNITGGNVLGGGLYATTTTANSVTARLTTGNDNSFRITAQNGVASNSTGTEVSRLGMNYVGTGWDSFTQYIRGSAAQNGAQVLWASNTAIANVNSSGVNVTGIVTATGNITGGNLTTAGQASITGNLTTASAVNFNLPNSSSTDVTVSSGLATAFKTRIGTTATNQYSWRTNLYYTGAAWQKDDATRGAWRLNQVCLTGNANSVMQFTYAPIGSTDVNELMTLTGEGLLSVTSNITGGNLNTAGQVVATGNITGGNITTAGNVTGTYLLGNVFYATGISANKIYNGTTEVAIGSSGGNANISIGGTSNVAVIYSGGVAITGDLSVTGNATLSGNILGDRIQNGTTSFDIQTASGNANITVGGTSNVVVFSSAGQNVSGYLTSSGNITGGNLITAGLISATGNVTSVGNISGSYILGNGSQLTGIVTGNSFGVIVVSGQSNVVADQATDTLTLAAGTGIAITTDAGNDIVTISSIATDSIFATGGDMGTVDEAVTTSEDLGTVTSAATVEYDLGTETTAGIVTPSLLLLPTYTVSQLGNLTAAPAGQFVYCSDESGGAVPAFSDGTNWRRVTDRAIVS